VWALYLQVVRELAQHAGHADILREQVLADARAERRRPTRERCTVGWRRMHHEPLFAAAAAGATASVEMHRRSHDSERETLHRWS